MRLHSSPRGLRAATMPTPAARLRALLLLALALALSIGPTPPATAALAQQGAALYGVEIIVFRASSIASTEDWNTPPTGRGFGGTPVHGAAGPQVQQLLPPQDYRLGGIEATLRTSGAWRPIAHAAWIQSAAAWGNHIGIALADLGINAPGLSGTVYLERAPIYLHLGFDVQLNQNGTTYTIKEMRSVRYNDKQYFDHPAFGIIAVVTPVKRGETAAPR